VKDRVAVVGVGFSTIARDTGLTYKQLTAQAVTAALADAGMAPTDVDGVCALAFGQPELTGESTDSAINERMVAEMMGMMPVNWYSPAPTNFGDNLSAAIAAVKAGFCHTALVVHTGRTVIRKSGGPPRPTYLAAGDMQWSTPFGIPAGPGLIAGLTMQRHMQVYGTTEEHFAHQSVNQRYHASLNDDALLRDPLTIQGYLDARWISRPCRLLDCDYPCDVSSAVIVTTEERASSWRQKPVFVEAAAMGSVHVSWEYLPDILTGAPKVAADTLWSRTDLRPSDVDCAMLYDGFSVMVFTWLESLGLCGPGEAGPFIAEGSTRLGGSVPVNTDGGACNAGRRHGAGHLIEAVRQLRGQSGERQVPDAEVAVYSVAHGPHCHTALLTAA
jgi:acetyl-CoA acetyltransferase